VACGTAESSPTSLLQKRPYVTLPVLPCRMAAGAQTLEALNPALPG
jgi:hypothetical protein